MSDLSDETTNRCGICGEPMAPNEQMFKYHGFSGPCPKPPLSKPGNLERPAEWWIERADLEGDLPVGVAGGAVPVSDLSDERETPEARARALLDGCGVRDAHLFTAGEVVGIANLVAERDQLARKVLALESTLREERERRGSTISCAFCFAVYPAGEDDESAIAATRAHVMACEKHPAAELRRQRDGYAAVAREAMAQAEALAGDGCHLDHALSALRAHLTDLEGGAR